MTDSMTSTQEPTRPLLTVENVTKRFGAIQALRDASLAAYPGEVLALAGENGAGKSTLLKILTGQYGRDGGEIRLDGELYAPENVFASRQHGVGIVFQETMLQPRFSIAENLLAGSYGSVSRAGLVSWSRMRSRAEELLRPVGLDVDVSRPAESLRLGEQRLVELAAAVADHPRLLLIDEITASLDANEVGRFFEVVHRLTDAGTTVVYVSHHLDEIFKLCDRVTVLRDGQTVAGGLTSEFTERTLTSAMVGHEVSTDRRGREQQPGTTPLLRLQKVAVEGVFTDLDLTVHPGEIVGLTGLQGAGADGVAKALFGLSAVSSGTVELDGVDYAPRRPADAVSRGVALVPRHRDEEGIIGRFSLTRNIGLPIVARNSRLGIVQAAKERAIASDLIARVGTRPNLPSIEADALSGGNRQKVVLAKWLATEPRLLLLDSPTRGVDVGAKEEIYALLSTLAQRGMAMIVVSEDLPELMTLARRIVVFKRGRVRHIFEPSDEWSRDGILEAML